MSVLADSLAEALDPVLLARRVGMEPDPWQSEVLRSSARRLVLLTARQAGKSSVVSVMAMHRALYHPGALILIFAPSQRQAVRLFKACARIYRELGRPVEAEVENALSMELENGSQIVALPADPNTVRGYPAVDLLIIDEAAWVSDELYETVRPMLAVSAGQLVVMSTPFGRRGFFYRAATTDDGRWTRYTVTAADCPRITPEFLEEERDSKGARVFAQEYECRFIDAAGSLFDGEDLAVIASEAVVPLDFDRPPLGRHLRSVAS